MNASILDFLECPTCASTKFDFRIYKGSGIDIQEGVIWCKNRDWFPIEDRVLELLPPDLQYQEDRNKFLGKYSQDLKALGLLDNDLGTPPDRAAEELNLIQAQQHHFDWYAENEKQAYNAYAAMPFWRVIDKRTFARWNAKILAERQHGPAKLLLDVGCAQGRSALMIAEAGVQVIGFDISKRMVRQAYVNFSEAFGPDLKSDFIVADGSHFPFVSGAFDYALVYGVLHHLPNPHAACQEIARILKPHGTYFGSENNRSIFRRIFDLLQRLSPAWHEEAGKQPLMSFRDLAGWFSGTGLTIETASTVFIPPHLVNALGVKLGGLVLATTDAVLSTFPFVKEQGGLILVEGTKG